MREPVVIKYKVGKQLFDSKDEARAFRKKVQARLDSKDYALSVSE